MGDQNQAPFSLRVDANCVQQASKISTTVFLAAVAQRIQPIVQASQ